MSVGLGLLNPVFAGKKGLAATLTKNFGGTATLFFDVIPSEYNEATGQMIPPEFEHQTIAFVQESLKKFVGVGVGGIQVSEGDMVGLVAASDLEHEIRNGSTKMMWQARRWIVTSQEPVSSGNERAMIRILASSQ